jgi:hypothetical protein
MALADDHFEESDAITPLDVHDIDLLLLRLCKYHGPAPRYDIAPDIAKGGAASDAAATDGARVASA